MKEVENLHKDVVEIIYQTKQEKKEVFQGSLKLFSGHTLFEYNIDTNVLSKAKYEYQNVNFKDAQKGIISTKRKIVMNKNCVYIPALNVKNAIKRYAKNYGRIINPTIIK